MAYIDIAAFIDPSLDENDKDNDGSNGPGSSPDIPANRSAVRDIFWVFFLLFYCACRSQKRSLFVGPRSTCLPFGIVVAGHDSQLDGQKKSARVWRGWVWNPTFL